MLTVKEHASSRYAARTHQNADEGDVTIAFAVDFTTAGERLTKTAAGPKYRAAALSDEPVQAARVLFSALRAVNGACLNVAGNGIHTLSKSGWSQAKVDAYVFSVIAQVHQHWPIGRIVSGGQTGVDLAGAVAGAALGIETCVTMPKGFLQRYADGVDRSHSELEVLAQIRAGADAVLANAMANALGVFASPVAQRPDREGAGPVERGGDRNSGMEP